ncbi:MAG: HEAT repeat domain-containing protein [Planctomycetota bacterium]|jgi:hypothetical protein
MSNAASPSPVSARPWALLAVLVVALGALPVLADEAPEEEMPLLDRIAAHEEQIETHENEKATEALLTDILLAVELYKETPGLEDPKEMEKAQEALVKMVGGLTKSRLDLVPVAAIEGLGEIGHEDGAKYLKPFLKPANEDLIPETTVAAIEAAGKLKSDSLVTPLLTIVEKSKNYDAAALAMTALGKYGASERWRVRILETLIKTVLKNKPGDSGGRGGGRGGSGVGGGGRGGGRGGPGGGRGGPGGGRAGQGADVRWATLAPILPKACNELTGQRFPTAEDWFDVYKEYKRELKTLFGDR